MTDQRLRDLERDATHGDLQAQARLLLERVRVGDLTEERVELAAYCGHAAAMIAIRASPSPVDEGIEKWVDGFDYWGKQAYVRAAIALARSSLHLWEHQATLGLLEQAVAAAEAWVRCPCADHENTALSAEEESRTLDYTPALATSQEAIVAARLAIAAAREAGLPGPSLWVSLGAVDLGEIWGAESVRAIISASLTEWALAPNRSST